MKTLYLECASGISGDMTVGALLDLGADRDGLLRCLETLKLPGYRIEITQVSKNGIGACSFDVILEAEEEHVHAHTHEDGSVHYHTHGHEHGHGHERGLKEILPIIEQSGISPRAKEISEKIFRLLARAEGKVHQTPPDEVHFHEVGAVDSIVDIVAAAICLDLLGVERVISSPLSEGTGYAWCRHGKIPVPVPAVLELTQMVSVPLKITDTQGEMVTPTGAAIVATLADSFSLPQSFTVEKIGVGAGKKDFPHANILRAMLIREQAEENDAVCVLQSSIDDSTPERLAYCQSLLLENGALDAYFTPIVMKKSRLGSELTVLCAPEKEKALTELIFRETSTIGLRKSKMERCVMARETCRVSLPEGEVAVKVCTWNGMTKYDVEYEDAAKAARSSGQPLDEIYRKVFAKLSETGNLKEK